jgi:hypothetical protein
MLGDGLESRLEVHVKAPHVLEVREGLDEGVSLTRHNREESEHQVTTHKNP